MVKSFQCRTMVKPIYEPPSPNVCVVLWMLVVWLCTNDATVVLMVKSWASVPQKPFKCNYDYISGTCQGFALRVPMCHFGPSRQNHTRTWAMEARWISALAGGRALPPVLRALFFVYRVKVCGSDTQVEVAAPSAIRSPRLQPHLGGNVERLVGVVWYSRFFVWLWGSLDRQGAASPVLPSSSSFGRMWFS
jgi:hypothetical protein